MVIIRFKDEAAKRRALGYLLGQFSFKTWATGEMMVPEDAMPALAHERISFTVEGPASYEHYGPTVRDSPATSV
jgi:hypothetical protein